MENINVILVILVSVLLIVLFGIVLIPFVNKKGFNMPVIFKSANGVLGAGNQVTEILKALYPDNPAIVIVDKIIDYAQIGVQKAEQLYFINTIAKEDRKEEALKFVYNALELAKIERNEAIDKIVDGAVEAAVLSLGHKSSKKEEI